MGCNNLGVGYENGRGVARDQARANALYEKACGLGDGLGCANLGFNHANGKGVAQDQARANALFEKSCGLGAGIGCSNLGFSHERGLGVGPDRARANALYLKACELGSATGCHNLGVAYQGGQGVARDPARANALYEKACGLGDGAGCTNLAGSLVRDREKARELLERGCALGEPAACDRLASGPEAGRAPSEKAVRSLAALAQRAPGRLPEVADRTVYRMAREASRLPLGSEARLELLQALFHAGWQPASDASWVWRNLALDLLERGLHDRAAEVALRVTEPYTLATMQVDRRFQRLVEAHPQRFDVDEALAHEIARLRVAAEQAPRSLRALVRLLSSLQKAPRYQEVLRLSDEAIRRARATGSPYEDADEYLPWLMDERARALRGLGRWQEAADQYAEAARLPEDGRPNASQAINLAGFYCELDRPQEALAAIGGVEDLSPYGRMELEHVRLMAALETGDRASAVRALSYLREHRPDSEDTFQWALVEADELDEAAHLLVDRLADPRRRQAALFSVQDLVERPATPRVALWRARWKTLLSRPEVRTAIAQVGRVERFQIAWNE
jgi:TPR repeat protein